MLPGPFALEAAFVTSTTLTATAPARLVAGVYTVTVHNPDGQTAITPTPHLVETWLRADYDVAVAGATVLFTDTSAGVVTGLQWSFGDGTTSTLPRVSHTYTTTGQLNRILLTVSGPAGVTTHATRGVFRYCLAPTCTPPPNSETRTK